MALGDPLAVASFRVQSMGGKPPIRQMHEQKSLVHPFHMEDWAPDESFQAGTFLKNPVKTWDYWRLNSEPAIVDNALAVYWMALVVIF